MPRGGQSISFCQTHFTTGDRIFVYGLVKGLEIDRCALPSCFRSGSDAVLSGREMIKAAAAAAVATTPPAGPASKKSGRVFALSNTLEVQTDPERYRCQLYIPVGLPPSIRRNGRFSYDYVLAIRNDASANRRGSAAEPFSKHHSIGARSEVHSGSSESLRAAPPARAATFNSYDSGDCALSPAKVLSPQISLSISIVPCSVLVCPLTEWIPCFFQFTNLAAAILPPPPIYPPLPARPISPTYLALNWDFGAAFSSGAPVALPIVGWSEGEQEPQQEFKLAKEKADAGLLFLRWLSYTCLDMFSTVHEAKLAGHVTPEGFATTGLDSFLAQPAECTELLRTHIAAEQGESAQAAEERPLLDRLRTGFDVQRLVSSVRWMTNSRGAKTNTGSFVSSFEADSLVRSNISTTYRISVGGNHLSDIQIVGLSTVDLALPNPPTKVYDSGKSAPLAPVRSGQVLEGYLGETVYVKAEVSKSSLAIVEICVRLKQTTTVYQAPLSPLEAIQWQRHRQNMGYRSGTGTSQLGLSWLDFRSYHTITNIDTTLIVVSTETVTVAESTGSVTQTLSANLPLFIPGNIEATFRHERLGVSYDMEIEFTVIATHGVVLDLASRTENGKHSPFITINGPLLPRSTSKVIWSYPVLLRPVKPPSAEFVLLTH